MAQKKTGRMPGSARRILIAAGVIAGVAAGAVLLDRLIRYPRCGDETDAMNVVIREVLPSMEELAGDEGFALEALEREEIGEEGYYPVRVTRFPRCPDGEEALRVVEERVLPGLSIEGGPELTLLEDQEIDGLRYFVVEVSRAGEGGEKETAATVYVQARNSQPFTKNEKGELEPAASEEAIPLGTVYVREKDSRPFARDETSGRLVPYE